MKKGGALAAGLLTAVLSGCATTRPEPEPTPVAQKIEIEAYLADLLRASQRDVSDPRDFTVIHDTGRQAFRRLDFDGDGAIEKDHPHEAVAYNTISILQKVGVGIRVGEADTMKDRIEYDHNERVLYIHPSQESDEAAAALEHFMDKNEAFWDLKALGWKPTPIEQKPVVVEPTPDN